MKCHLSRCFDCICSLHSKRKVSASYRSGILKSMQTHLVRQDSQCNGHKASSGHADNIPNALQACNGQLHKTVSFQNHRLPSTTRLPLLVSAEAVSGPAFSPHGLFHVARHGHFLHIPICLRRLCQHIHPHFFHVHDYDDLLF